MLYKAWDIMQTDIIIAFVIGIIIIFAVLILYIKGDMQHLKTLGRLLGILGGTAAFAGAVLE
jgi:phosphoglycerol transferase MdoB-like AlkP superfamily enzyme